MLNREIQPVVIAVTKVDFVFIQGGYIGIEHVPRNLAFSPAEVSESDGLVSVKLAYRI